MAPSPGEQLKIFHEAKKEFTGNEAAGALPAVDAIEDLLKKSRGSAEEVRSGLYKAVIGGLAAACALSMIPFTSNFASHFAGEVFSWLTGPAVSKGITGPLNDYLDNIFPTKEVAARQLVTGIENGALSNAELVDSLVDTGMKDKEILKVVKIAKVLRFNKQTADDYAMLDRYENAIIAAQLQNARDEVDAAIKDREALITEYKRLEREQVMEAVAAPTPAELPPGGVPGAV